MTRLPSTFIAAAALIAALAAPAAAQDEAQRPEPRHAQPRGERQATRGEARGGGSEARGGDRAARAEGGRSRGTDDQGRMRAPVQRAVPREAPPAAVAPAPQPRVERAPAPTTSSTAETNDEQRRAQPRGGRDRGDNPRVGRAVPRDGSYDGRRRDGRSRGGTIYAPRGYYGGGRYYNNYYPRYYYPRRLYPYGYGAFGLGFFYYNPYSWYGLHGYYNDPYYYGAPYYYGSPYYGAPVYSQPDDAYYTGELRLLVEPREAEVYVDGYFAGNVDDFDGIFQSLRLEEGTHKIEIVAPGYEPLEVDIRTEPGRKITYRGQLRRKL